MIYDKGFQPFPDVGPHSPSSTRGPQGGHSINSSWQFIGNAINLLKGVRFETQPNNNHALRSKMESEAGPPSCNTLSQPPPVTQESRSSLLLGRCLRQLRKSCAGADVVYSQAERVFILEHYFTSKSSAAVREAFSNAYPDKEVPNKITIHRLVTKFRNTGSVCDK
jgi:hypothetical protein